MRRFTRTLPLLVLSSLVWVGCAPHVATPNPAPTPAVSEQVFLRTELFFGLSKPDGAMVSDAAFAHFVDREITPRFPDGLTLIPARGQWRGENGQVVREPAMILILLYPHGSREQADAKIETIRAAYIQQFSQEAVLRIDHTGDTVRF